MNARAPIPPRLARIPPRPASDKDGERVAGTDFQPVSSIVPGLVDPHVAAAIDRALADGDPAKAARMRAMLADFEERRDGA